MPDEERVRTKRRKLDSIITKLHQTTPLENESLEEGENQKDFKRCLAYNISEEVEKQKDEGSNKKKKKHLSESSDADELPRRIECTACGRNVNPAHGTICRHPGLNVLVCKKCSQYYNSGPFTRDEFGVEEQCRWCGDGGALLCCDNCEKAFCKLCIKRNLGRSVLKEIVNAPEGTEWLCFCCNSKPLSKLVKAGKRIMNILETRKGQKTLFKTKKGPALVVTPSQKERRNRLSSINENMGMSSDGALSPCESPTKKTMPEINDSDSHPDDDDDDDDNDDDSDQNSDSKPASRIANRKHGKKNGSTKEDVFSD
ncbi:hypothetical protein OS493_036611 [Desmophyllum pertusum]|uniref:PHD-type domain-containing protein n=1 Tax=Desmophyllum pertusum TaxID=174260 RepID=A0A9W9ZK38_9CNID|nr:hypothetical protein OS493_036611 [Desmophyllum pertusum]